MTLNLIFKRHYLWAVTTQNYKPDNVSLIPGTRMKAERGTGKMAQWL